jgi:predicted nuclease of predicted toxin-antitoxin system
VKLLLDENLSPRLASALSELYPGSQAVRECGLQGASDTEVWRYAQKNGLVMVSKDSDFAQRSFVFGNPPKVIWPRIGNCTTMRVDFVLRNTVQRVYAFERDEESCLVLTHPRSS